MPSPVGHVLGGIAAGGLALEMAGGRESPARHPWTPWGTAALFGALGALPDIDFLFGSHSTYTHSIGACILVLAGTFWWVRPRRPAMAVAVMLAYGSHLLLDWLGNDTTPPIGIMAMWPLSDAFYQSDLHWFMAISRRYWLANFWVHNLTAVAWEIVLLGPVAGLALWRNRAHPPARAGAEAPSS